MSILSFVDRYFADTDKRVMEAFERARRFEYDSTLKYSETSSYLTDLLYTDLLGLRLRAAALWKKIRNPLP